MISGSHFIPFDKNKIIKGRIKSSKIDLETVEKIAQDEIFVPSKNVSTRAQFRSNYDRIVRFANDGTYSVVSSDTDTTRTYFSVAENKEFYKKNPQLSKKIERLEDEIFKEIPIFSKNNKPYLISNFGRILEHNYYGDEILINENKFDIVREKYITIKLSTADKKDHQVSLTKLIAFVFLKEEYLREDQIKDFQLLDPNSEFCTKISGIDPLNFSIEDIDIVRHKNLFKKKR